jgi:hypothetical protein
MTILRAKSRLDHSRRLFTALNGYLHSNASLIWLVSDQGAGMDHIQAAKEIVRRHCEAFDEATDDQLEEIGGKSLSDRFFWRGMHPFYEIEGAASVIQTFWRPLRRSLTSLQRREDIFFAGENDVDGGASVWTCSMGHFMGLFDNDWLGIPATGRMAFLRYAEFFKIENDEIVESAFFCDLIGLMHQAGCYPLPPMTGASFVYPGPRTHDGLQFGPVAPDETTATLVLVNRMIEDLSSINHMDDYLCPPDLLARTWHDDMIWYGPCGIGASYTITRYQEQHQYPFRLNLTDKTYNGHVARIAEGKYCGFFGWSNLRNRNKGGFLGLPAAQESAEMRIVDIYRRHGDKLAENWVFIDLPHYLAQQGLDVFVRLKELRRLPG